MTPTKMDERTRETVELTSMILREKMRKWETIPPGTDPGSAEWCIISSN